jgi:hypothetical protein
MINKNSFRNYKKSKREKSASGLFLAAPKDILGSKDSKNYLFNSGSSLDWARSQPKIVEAFKSADCYEYVECPAALIPAPAVAGGPPVVYPEVEFTEAEPLKTVCVDDKLAAYDARILARNTTTINDINAAVGLSAAERAKQLLEAQIAYGIAQDKRFTIEEDFMKEFISRDSIWRARKKEHNQKICNVIKVFSENIGPSAMGHVSESFRANRFRETWALLNEHLSAVKGGTESRSAAMDMLSRAVWDGKDFSIHIDYMTTLFNQCVSSGYTLDEQLRIDYLANSFKRSSNVMFHKLIDNFNFLTEKRYSDLLSRLQVKASASAMTKNVSDGRHEYVAATTAGAATVSSAKGASKRSAKKQRKDKKSEQAHTTNTKVPDERRCHNCGKKGHLEVNCWFKNKCRECGNVGHDARHCPNLTRAYVAEHNDDEDNTDNGEVSLAKTFKDKNPKKRKTDA